MEERKFFCTNCGNELSGNVRFCPNCGTPVPEWTMEESAEDTADAGNAEKTENAEGAAETLEDTETFIDTEKYENMANTDTFEEETGDFSEEAGDKNPSSKRRRRLIVSLVVIAAVIVAVILFFCLRPTSVNLNDYVTVEYTGFDGYGSAQCSFDKEAFLNKYSGKIKVSTTGNTFLDNLYGYGDAAEEMYYDCVGYYFDYGDSQNGKLSNGDEISLIWDCDDDLAKSMYGVTLKHKDSTYTVQDLSDSEVVDVFDSVRLVASGTAPMGTAVIETDSYLEEWYFELSKDTELSNGDTVIITITDEGINFLAENYGVTPAATDREYTIEGLSEYITQVSDIPESLLNDIRSVAETTIRGNAVNNWNLSTLTGMEYIGIYLFYNEGYETQDMYDHTTELFVIYKVNAHEEDADYNYEGDFSYYTYVKMYNPVLNPDGTGNIDLDDAHLCDNRFEHEYTGTNDWGETDRGLYYSGYAVLSELCDALVYNEYNFGAYDTSLAVSDDNTLVNDFSDAQEE